MALIKCPACNADISDHAAVCVRCGRQMQESVGGKAANYSSKPDFDDLDIDDVFGTGPSFWNKYKAVVIVAVILVIAAVAIPIGYNRWTEQQKPKRANALVESGNEFFRKGSFDNAIAEYDRAIWLKPDLVDAYSARGDAYFNKGNHDRAIADYDRVIQLNPNSARAYVNRGLTYLDKNDINGAYADYSRAVLLDSDLAAALKQSLADAYFSRGNDHSKKSDHDRAISDYDRVIELAPNADGAYFNRGNSYYYKKNNYKAIADWEASLRLDPNKADAKKNIAIVQRQSGYHGSSYGNTGGSSYGSASGSSYGSTGGSFKAPGNNSGTGRKGVAGVGYGSGYGSGFGGSGGGIDDLLGGLMSGGGGGGLDTKKRGELKQGPFQPGSMGAMSGGRSRANINSVISQNMASLRHAYNRRLRDKPGLSGRITVKFAINESGKVVYAQMVESTMADPALEKAIVDMVKGFVFEEINKPGDVTEVTYPFTFSQ